MTKQINFFMLDADDKAFREQVTALGGITLYYRSRSHALESVGTDSDDGRTEYLSELCIVPYELVGQVAQRDEPVLGWYLIEMSVSPVIEFSRSVRAGERLRRGRLWAAMETSWWTADGVETRVSRGPTFERLYDGLSKWIRRSYRKDPKFGFYCGPTAWDWVQAGGELSQL